MLQLRSTATSSPPDRLSSLSRALIVVQTSITLFLSYLLRPVPSDVQLFI